MTHLGLASQKPDFARFNYAEKAEYWWVGLGNVRDGGHSDHAVGQRHCGESSAALVARCRNRHPFYTEAVLATLAISRGMALLSGVL